MNLIAISDIYSDIGIVQDLISIISKSRDNEAVIIVAGDIGMKTASKHYGHDVNSVIFSLSKICKHIKVTMERTKLIARQPNLT